MLTVDDYKEKIKKLLALAQSPSEAEAKAALLKARKLMAEYKLTEADLKEAEEQPVKDKLFHFPVKAIYIGLKTINIKI